MYYLSRHILSAICIATLMAVIAACGSTAKVKEDVKHLEPALPIDLGYGMTITKMDIAHDTVTLTVAVSENTIVPFEQIPQTANEVTESLVEEMSKSDNHDVETLLSDCREGGLPIRFDFQNFDNQHFATTISPTQL